MSAVFAPLAVAVPLIAAALVTVIGGRLPRAVQALVSIGSSCFATAACAVLAHDAASRGTVVHWFGGWTPHHGIAVGIAFVVDPAAAALAAFATFLTTAALLFAWTYYEQDDGAFSALMLVFSAALTGFFLTGDLFNLFVFFELMSVSAYALTGFRSEDTSAVHGAFSFGVVNSTGAFFVLIGIAMVYARTGALNMAQIAHALAGSGNVLVAVAFAMIVAGFLVKASIVPYHFWLSDAHAVAPTPLCALFSGIMVQAGLYAVARCYWSVFSSALAPHADGVRDILLAFGLLTAVLGAVMCYSQRHMKRLLAFSTVAHSGIMLCAIAFLNPAGLAGFFVYVLGHGLAKGSLFFSSGILLNRYSTVDVEQLRGELREVPWLALIFALGGLALAGVPPFGTFAGKVMIDRGAAAAHLEWVAPILLIAAALTGASVLNAAGRMMFGWGAAPDPSALTPGTEQPETQPARGVALVVMAVPTIALIALALVAGFIPSLGPVAFSAGARFVDRSLQEAVVLAGASGAALAPGRSFDVIGAAGSGLAAGALALAFASLGLFGHRARRLWKSLSALYETSMRIPHAWHTGIVTDYIAWLVVGTAALGAGLLVLLR